jgi:hypothetical protein
MFTYICRAVPLRYCEHASLAVAEVSKRLEARHPRNVDTANKNSAIFQRVTSFVGSW